MYLCHRARKLHIVSVITHQHRIISVLISSLLIRWLVDAGDVNRQRRHGDTAYVTLHNCSSSCAKRTQSNISGVNLQTSLFLFDISTASLLHRLVFDISNPLRIPGKVHFEHFHSVWPNILGFIILIVSLAIKCVTITTIVVTIVNNF